MAEKKMLSIVSKTLITNVIRHTDSHNKIVEESDMWKQRKKERSPHSSRDSFLKDRRLDMNYEYHNSRKRQAHMDEEPRSTYWMNELYKAEEEDKNRWGHSGFKELYPEKFESSSSSSKSSHRKHKHRDGKEKKIKEGKSRKRTYSEQRDTDSESEKTKTKKHKKKHKHKEREKKKKRKHKKKHHKEEDSDSS